MRTTAVLFQIHYFDRWAERAFRRMRADAPPGYEFVVLMHLAPGAPVPERVLRYPHHVVRTPELRALPYPAKAGGPDWDLWTGGHTDLITMHCSLAHPGYDRYWAIEYDVRYTGPWRRFFAAFEEDDSDLLAPLLRTRRNAPEWANWPSLAAPGGEPQPGDDQAVSGFMPIFRASGRLMRAMDEAYRAGWGGHIECSFATIATVRGFRVTDFGGDGDFTPGPYRGRFYSGTARDVYHAPGTLVFKPTFFRTGSRPHMIWHPVKPFWPGVEFRQELRAARAAVGRVLRARAPWLVPARWRTPGCFTNSRRAVPALGGVQRVQAGPNA
ncbi:MAG: hypothetical protein ICV73_28735 [Acetobacteraceae bacterium]|nr:hypothetical protein [Acetobacteraceae bacterium]